MSDSFRATPPHQQWSSGNGKNDNPGAFGNAPANESNIDGSDVGKVVLFGLLGGIVSAAGYLIYQRLPDEQKERLHDQAKTLIAQRITEIRQNFNI